jgi:hypothetical protein
MLVKRRQHQKKFNVGLPIFFVDGRGPLFLQMEDDLNILVNEGRQQFFSSSERQLILSETKIRRYNLVATTQHTIQNNLKQLLLVWYYNQ